MARWKEVTTVNLVADQDQEAAEVLALANEFASLRDEPVTSTVKRLLREVLPKRIAEFKSTSKEFS
jgi:hypothetical protein